MWGFNFLTIGTKELCSLWKEMLSSWASLQFIKTKIFLNLMVITMKVEREICEHIWIFGHKEKG